MGCALRAIERGMLHQIASKQTLLVAIQEETIEASYDVLAVGATLMVVAVVLITNATTMFVAMSVRVVHVISSGPSSPRPSVFAHSLFPLTIGK